MKFPTKRIFRIFCIWKITEFMPTCLRGAVFLRQLVVDLGMYRNIGSKSASYRLASNLSLIHI